MTKILCADTTSENCSISIFDKLSLLGNVNSRIERSHSKLLLKLIDDLLNKCNLELSNIDAFSISKGPGSYTGLRIGISSFKGLCYSLDKPLISVNTLELLSNFATTKISDTTYYMCPMIDARRMEVFTKLFDQDLNQIIDDQAMILDRKSFNEYKSKKIYFFGSGSNKFNEIIDKENFIFINGIYPNTKFMGDLSFNKFERNDFEDLSSFEPFYIKEYYFIKN
tara:strand:+ start:315 stop:986 length:672 start_codon:yes stop_codon:yes gene_type:complete